MLGGLSDKDWQRVQQDLQDHINAFYDAYGENGSRGQEIRKETEDYLILADKSGQELNEIADITNVDRNELSQRMHKEARKRYGGENAGDAWSVKDPIVIIKE